jgi:hypothetical protein
MAVNDLQCPNCGAPVDFAGSTQAICSFCQSKLYFTSDRVRTESVLNEVLEGKPATAGIDLSGIQESLRAGNKIGAIKLYREQTGTGLTEAKDAVDAIERGEMPVVTADQRRGAMRTSIQSRRASTYGCLGCLPILLFVGLCAGLITLSSQVAFRAWGPLDQVMKIVNNDPEVTQAFGKPLSVGPFIMGSLSGGATSSSAHFNVPLYGPKRSGTLQVSGSWRRGVWDISIDVRYDGEDGEEQTIYITQKVK